MQIALLAAQKPTAKRKRHPHLARRQYHRRAIRHRVFAPRWFGINQCLRVVMLRVGKNIRRQSLFHHLTAPHDANAAGNPAHNVQIMGDEHHRHAKPRLQPRHQIQNFRLNGHIQRGRRLIRDQDIGVIRQGHRDHHALTLTAGKFMRIASHAIFRLGDFHQSQHLQRPRACGPMTQALMPPYRFNQLAANGIKRVQRGHRFLKDHGDLSAPNGVQLRFWQANQVGAAVIRHPRCAPVCGQKPHRRHQHLAFARPGFAHNRKSFACIHI